MKPRLRLKGRVWSCASLVKASYLDILIWRIGYGYTVREAWADWEKQL